MYIGKTGIKFTFQCLEQALSVSRSSKTAELYLSVAGVLYCELFSQSASIGGLRALVSLCHENVKLLNLFDNRQWEAETLSGNNPSTSPPYTSI